MKLTCHSCSRGALQNRSNPNKLQIRHYIKLLVNDIPKIHTSLNILRKICMVQKYIKFLENIMTLTP